MVTVLPLQAGSTRLHGGLHLQHADLAIKSIDKIDASNA